MLQNGIYEARARKAKITETSDGVKFVEVDLIVDNIQNIHWRSPLTKGGLKKTFHSLLQMGAKMRTNELDEVEDILEGVGSKQFKVEILNIECDENEAPGAFKSFAKVVL